MIKQIRLNLRATKMFFVVRFVTASIVGVLYFLLAAFLQYTLVAILGSNTFNYIIGGIVSLVVGIVVCSYVGSVLFFFVRGWHIGAIAYAHQIVKKHLPAMDVGVTTFNKHFTSFAAVYGLGMLIRRAARAAMHTLWGLLDSVPILCELERFADNPIVEHVAEDILDTSFDALVYYIIRYTKPGLRDDLEVVPTAIKKYLYALPQLLVASLSTFLFLYTAPRAIATFVVLTVFLKNGIVDGIMVVALLPPVFYLLRHSIFEPLETIVLMSGYTKYCKNSSEEEEAGSAYTEAVDKILESMGLVSESEASGEDEDDIAADEAGPATKQVRRKKKDQEEGVTIPLASRCKDNIVPDGLDYEECEEPAVVTEGARTSSTTITLKGKNAGIAISAVKDSDARAAEVVQQPRPPIGLSALAKKMRAEDAEAQAVGGTIEAVDDLPIDDDVEEIRGKSTAAGMGGLSAMLQRSSQYAQVQEDLEDSGLGMGPDTEEEQVIPVSRMSGMLSGMDRSKLMSAFSRSLEEEESGHSESFEDTLGGGSLDG